MTHNYAPSSDADVESMVRAVTGYEDTPDELSSATFGTILDLSKLTLTTETSIDDDEADNDVWYTDAPLGQALVFVTAIRAKVAVENYSITSWTVGDQTIDVRNAGDAEQVQFDQWMSYVADGISQSDNAEPSSPSPSNTASFIT